MAYRELLEQYPLYRKFKKQLPWYGLDQVDKPTIHMSCPTCASNQTFSMVNEYYEGAAKNENIEGRVVRAVYRCAGCNQFRRYFFLKLGNEKDYVVKVGQWPPWTIEIDRDLKALLGPHVELFRKGIVSESQGYGIAAFAYYRRIVESIIDELLEGIGQLLGGSDLEKYADALKRTKNTRVAQEKIELVKDLLPLSLRPGGTNPLSLLHTALSEGLHAEDDERCMELAAGIRQVMVFLASQISVHKQRAAKFTEGMKKLLEKKASPASGAAIK